MTYPSAPQYQQSPQPAPLGASSPDDISLPLYGASFGQAVKRFFKQYAKFNGRASRSEYWWVALFVFLVSLVPAALFSIGIGTSIAWAAQNSVVSDLGDYQYESSPGIVAAPTAIVLFVGLFLWAAIWLALLVPGIALMWRRLHDANFPGPLFFLSFIPSVGNIIMLVFALLPSNPEGRRFDAPTV